MTSRIISLVSLLFVVNFFQAQEFSWANSVSGNGSVWGIEAVKDANGNTYLIGFSTGSSFEYDGVNYNTNGSGDTFFAKLDTNKNLIWMKVIGGDDPNYVDEVKDVHIDSFGDIYLSIKAVGNNFIYNGQVLSGIGYPGQYGGEAVLLKVNSDGDYIWHDSGQGGDNFTEISTDAAGNVYITGSFDSTITLGGSITLTNPSSAAIRDLLVAKYQSDGTILWAKNAGGTQLNASAVGYAVKINSQSNEIILLAHADGNISFDGMPMPVNSNSNEGSLIVSLDPEGTLNWMKLILDLGNNGYNTCVGLDVSSSGIIGVCGYSTGFGNGLIGFYNSDGSIISEYSHPSSDDLRIQSIAFNESNEAYISGACNNGAIIGISPGTATLTDSTGFMAKLDLNQQVQWITEFNSPYLAMSKLYYDNGRILYAGIINDDFIYNSGQSIISNSGIDGIFAEGSDETLNIETVLMEGLMLYPNPTPGIVSLVSKSTLNNVELLLTNVQGQLISQQVFETLSTTQIKLPSAAGVYFLTLRTANGQSTVKLIKQ